MTLKNWKDTKAILLLRLGLGLVFIYAGVNTLIDSSSWLGFVPVWLRHILAAEKFLFWHGLAETALGFLILIGFALPIVSLLAFFDLAAILVFYGIDPVTFRDFGLMTAALALAILAFQSGKSDTP